MFTISDTTGPTKAKCYALAAHQSIGQKRKFASRDATPDQYYFHPLRVAELVATVTSDEEIVQAAALHDILEDVSPKNRMYDAQSILHMFGNRVLDLVISVTNVFSKDAGQREVLLEAVTVLRASWLAARGPRCPTAQLLEKDFARADGLNREERKALERERICGLSDSALIIKRADLYDNSRELAMSGAFGQKWLNEKDQLEAVIGSWLHVHSPVSA